MYAIKNEHGDFYTGFDYVFQGEKYANFTRFKEEPKKYKPIKDAIKLSILNKSVKRYATQAPVPIRKGIHKSSTIDSITIFVISIIILP